MKNEELNMIKKSISFLEKKDLKAAINSLKGWGDDESKHISVIALNRLSSMIFTDAIDSMDPKDIKSLEKRFNHPKYFVEGKTRSYVTEYFWLSPDWYITETHFSSAHYPNFKAPQAMIRYWKKLDKTSPSLMFQVASMLKEMII